MEYAFDTNTVINLMRGLQSVRVNRENAQKGGARFFIPPFVNIDEIIENTGLGRKEVETLLIN